MNSLTGNARFYLTQIVQNMDGISWLSRAECESIYFLHAWLCGVSHGPLTVFQWDLLYDLVETSAQDTAFSAEDLSDELYVIRNSMRGAA